MPLLIIPKAELEREGHVLLWCESCSQPRDFVQRDLRYENFATFNGFPILWCESCKSWAIPGNLRYLIAGPVALAKENEKFEINFNPGGGRSEVDYSQYPHFKFSSMDYMFYPGLWRPSQDGALTPIFFRRRVLHRYHSDPDYDLHYTSNSYGTVVIPPGHHIGFGIQQARSGRHVARRYSCFARRRNTLPAVRKCGLRPRPDFRFLPGAN